jgi:hypothetical protein
MKLIAHRGNYSGINKELENNPEYISKAIRKGFDVEIDVRLIEGNWYLGHDEPQYKINIEDYLSQSHWLHCKNIEALERLYNEYKEANFFWHQKDMYTITSQGFLWNYPGSPTLNNSITLFPKTKEEALNAAGICDNDFSEIKKWIL